MVEHKKLTKQEQEQLIKKVDSIIFADSFDRSNEKIDELLNDEHNRENINSIIRELITKKLPIIAIYKLLNRHIHIDTNTKNELKILLFLADIQNKTLHHRKENECLELLKDILKNYTHSNYITNITIISNNFDKIFNKCKIDLEILNIMNNGIEIVNKLPIDISSYISLYNKIILKHNQNNLPKCTLYPIFYKYYKFIEEKQIERRFEKFFEIIQKLCIKDTITKLNTCNVGSIASFTEIKDKNGDLFESAEVLETKNIMLIRSEENSLNLALAIKVNDEIKGTIEKKYEKAVNRNRQMVILDNTHKKIYIVLHFVADQNEEQIKKIKSEFISDIATLSEQYVNYNIIIIGDCNGVFHESEGKVNITDSIHDNIHIKYYGKFSGHGALDYYGANGIDIVGSYETDIFTNNLYKLNYPDFDEDIKKNLESIFPNYMTLLGFFGMGETGEHFSDHVRLQINTRFDTSCIISSTLSYLLAFQTFKYRVLQENIEDIVRYIESLPDIKI